MTFGENLKRLRLTVNLTQEEVAIKLQISRQSISKWEKDIALPAIIYIISLTKIYQCSIEDIFLPIIDSL